MMPSLIFAFSVGALIQFAFSYCRALLLTSSETALSKQVREIAGISADHVAASDFYRLLHLVRFAPHLDGDASQVRAIRIYYVVTSLASKVAALVSAKAFRWLNSELSRCAYFAAVALDRRLAAAPAK